MKPLLRYLLPNAASSNDKTLADSEVSGAGSEGAAISKDKTSSRSNHQRLLAIEIFNSLVKSSHKNSELLNCLESNIELISGVLVSVLKSSDSW